MAMNGDSLWLVVSFFGLTMLLGFLTYQHASESSTIVSLLCAFIASAIGIWLSRRIHMTSLVDKNVSRGKKRHIALRDNRPIVLKSMEIYVQSALMAIFMVIFALSAIMWSFSTEELSNPDDSSTRFFVCSNDEIIWWEDAGNGTGCIDGSDIGLVPDSWCTFPECDSPELRLDRYSNRLSDVARNGFPLLLTTAAVPIVGMMFVPLYVLKHEPAMLEHQSLLIRRFANRIVGTGAIAFLLQQAWDVGSALNPSNPFEFGVPYVQSMIEWMTWMSGGVLLFATIITWDFFSKYERRIRFLDHVGKFQWYEFRSDDDGILELVVYNDIVPRVALDVRGDNVGWGDSVNSSLGNKVVMGDAGLGENIVTGRSVITTGIGKRISLRLEQEEE